MKKRIYSLLLIGFVAISCSENQPSPDAATQVAGTYDLIYSYYSITGQDSVCFPGSVMLTRVDPTTVKPTFQLTCLINSAIERSTWTLTAVNSDSISYRSADYAGGIKNGQLTISGYADGTLSFRFKKRP